MLRRFKGTAVRTRSLETEAEAGWDAAETKLMTAADIFNIFRLFFSLFG